MGDPLAVLEITSRAAWRAWLEAHHATSPGVTLVTWKKRHASKHVPWDDVVREALCFGWIDSVAGRVDADRSSVRVTPRRPGSAWSARNKAHVAQLDADGLLAPAGRDAIARAVADGSWTFLDDVEQGTVPDDLARALDAEGQRGAWDALPFSTRRATLEWIKTAKRPPTRAARIAHTVAACRAGTRPR